MKTNLVVTLILFVLSSTAFADTPGDIIARNLGYRKGAFKATQQFCYLDVRPGSEPDTYWVSFRTPDNSYWSVPLCPNNPQRCTGTWATVLNSNGDRALEYSWQALDVTFQYNSSTNEITSISLIDPEGDQCVLQ